MKTVRSPRSSRPAPSRESAELRVRLLEAEATLRAIRNGEVDAVVVAGKGGDQVFTLQGAEHAYRVLIESMNEGALTLTADTTILYANQCFARMVRSPLERVTGGSFLRFLPPADRTLLRPLLRQPHKAGAKIQVRLRAGDGAQIPAQISIRPLAKNGFNRATIGMVVTDVTDARRNEDMLRALSRRLVQAQEAERGRVALELHDNITQLLCAAHFRSQALANRLSAHDGLANQEAMKLRELLREAAGEVERVSRDLRPSKLEHLGLVAVLRDSSMKFAERTGVSVKLACGKFTARLPTDTELALYRIFQEALRNVEKHSHAGHVTVRLKQHGAFVQLAVNDDGIGFDPAAHLAKRKGKDELGLLGMRERAMYAGGALKIKSARRVGTEIDVRVPMPPKPA